MDWKSVFRRRFLRSTFRGAWRYVFGKRGQRWVISQRLSTRLRVMMLLFTPGTMRTLRPTRTRLWVDREGFARIRTLIRRAQHTIIIQMFIWKDDRLGREIASLLLGAADRGVKVFVTKEEVGDFFEGELDFLGTKERGETPVWERFWHHPNIRISHASHNDHSKVYVFDHHTMLLTGMNIGEEYNGPWHDYTVELRGERFVQQYLTRGGLPVAGPVTLILNTEGERRIRHAVMELLSSAKQSIVLEQSYLSDKRVLQALIDRSREGIHVTVILPSESDVHHYTNMQTINVLMNRGSPRFMRVFLFHGMIHGKIILVDRSRAFLGSANLFEASLDEMGETNILVEGGIRRVVQRLREVLREDLLRSRALKSPPVLQWFERWMAWMRL
jgi:cardiolipin synthase